MATRPDYIGLNNPAVFNYANDAGLIPSYFTDAIIPDEESIKDLNPVAFADPYGKTYPCHTKVACVMSAIWNAANGDTEYLSDNIKAHAKVLGIESDVDKIYDHFENVMSKAAAAANAVPEPRYALEVDFQGHNGLDKKGFYPITTPYDLMASANRLAEDYNRGTIGAPVMRKVAMAIADAATAFDSLPLAVRRFSISNMADPYMAASMFTQRNKEANVNNGEYMAVLDGLKTRMAKAASIEEAIEAGEQALEALYMLDAKNNMNPRWEDNPAYMLMCGPSPEEFDKAASSSVFICEVPVPVAALTALDDKVLDYQFSKPAAAHMKAAKARLMDNPTPVDTTYAGTQIESLPIEVQHKLLRILSAE